MTEEWTDHQISVFVLYCIVSFIVFFIGVSMATMQDGFAYLGILAQLLVCIFAVADFIIPFHGVVTND